VIQDHVSGRYHRFTPSAHYYISMMDGNQTIQQLWEQCIEHLGDDAPSQDEIIQMLGQLHAADVLLTDATLDAGDLMRRNVLHRRMSLKQRFMNPMALRFPLFDPEKFLNRTIRYLGPLMGWSGLLLWILVVVSAIVLIGQHWSELTENIVDRILAPQNLLVLWLVYPVVKAFHELGHAYAVKKWGGEVHEIGIMLLVFMPIPYVDASAASAFRDKRKRMLVGAAGILVELFLAAIALFVWLNTDHGLVRTIAYNVMLIGGVSTLLFNGNPLLRFDGYYVFSDAIEIPNLGRRANQHLGYLVQRYLFGNTRAKSPATADGEARWFVFYGIASFIYRMTVVAGIIMFVAGKFFFIGVLLAIWAFISILVFPVIRMINFVLNSPKIQRQRSRAVTVSAGFVVLLLLLTVVAPFPLWTRAEGVIWLPDQAIVRAGTSCFIKKIEKEPNKYVRAGEPLIRCEEPLLAVKVRVLEAKLEELQTKYAAQLHEDRVAALVTAEEKQSVTQELENARERMSKLLIRSPQDGIFIMQKSADQPGRFISKGEQVAFVLGDQVPMIRAVVKQNDIDLVRRRTTDVSVMLASNIGSVLPASIYREIPGATDQLPSAALSTASGGTIDLDPRKADDMRTVEQLFLFDIKAVLVDWREQVGGRVYVRFDHGAEPIALQLYRRLRQLFLGRFGV
jgi:putative peptide zinc metalloprotease protein